MFWHLDSSHDLLRYSGSSAFARLCLLYWSIFMYVGLYCWTRVVPSTLGSLLCLWLLHAVVLKPQYLS